MKENIRIITGFELWQGAFSAAYSGSKMETKAKEKMMEYATTSSQWYGLYFLFPIGSPQNLLALNKMAETAIEGYDWDCVYLCARDNTELKLLAYHKMAELNSLYYKVLNDNMEKKPSTFFKE
jgi:hypothetical protein